jgi:hypothetical protein
MHLQRRFHWPEYIACSEVMVRFSDSAQAQIVITLKFDRFPAHGQAHSCPCSFPPALQLHTTLDSDHSIPLPRLTRISGLAHAHMRICQSATAMPGLSIRGTPLSLPPVFRTSIPSQTGILDPYQHTHTPGYAPSPPNCFRKQCCLSHAPRPSL